MKQRNSVIWGTLLVAILILACGGGGAVATTVSQPEQPVVTDAPVTEEVAATEAPVEETVPEYVLYEDDGGFLSAEIPGEWLYERNENTNIVSDEFYPEAGGAYVQSMVYDDGTTWNQSMAGQVALIVLNQGYTNGAGDIRISKDEPQSDGSEWLTWTSKAGNYSGVTVFKASGKKLILFSVLYNNDAKDVYSEQLDYILSTLTFTK